MWSNVFKLLVLRVWGFYVPRNQTCPIYEQSRYYQAFCCPVENYSFLIFPLLEWKHIVWYLETIKTEGIDDFEDVGRKMASLRLHPNATDASVQRRLAMLGPLLEFCKNRLELAYAFHCIMAYVGKEAELLHNDLSPSNMMFHFGAFDDVHRVFIGVIDWGRASRPKEKICSHYAV